MVYVHKAFEAFFKLKNSLTSDNDNLQKHLKYLVYSKVSNVFLGKWSPQDKGPRVPTFVNPALDRSVAITQGTMTLKNRNFVLSVIDINMFNIIEILFCDNHSHSLHIPNYLGFEH